MNNRTTRFIFCVMAFAASAAAQTNTFPASGNVGIGTTTPSSKLEVDGPDSTWLAKFATTSYALGIYNGANGGSSGAQILSMGNYPLMLGANGNTPITILPGTGQGGTSQNSGNVGIGTTAPSAPLEVNGNVKLTSGSGASITFQDGTVQSTAYTGVVCGGDYAESVNVAGDRKNYEPGDVLVIGEESGSDVLKSSEPYSTLVAGIYSTKPGTVGRRQTSDAKTSTTEVPMAMVGIVPTKVSAENGQIKRGDLLVTSSTPGYAMKGTDRGRMLGAVIGKALGSLDTGTGVIEVVVTLQ